MRNVALVWVDHDGRSGALFGVYAGLRPFASRLTGPPA